MKPEFFDDETEAQSGVEIRGGPEALAAYAGKVIAMKAGEVRASATTWSDCIAAVKQLGLALDSVEFMLVPPAPLIV